jgi:hypothetical protein
MVPPHSLKSNAFPNVLTIRNDLAGGARWQGRDMTKS